METNFFKVSNVFLTDVSATLKKFVTIVLSKKYIFTHLQELLVHSFFNCNLILHVLTIYYSFKDHKFITKLCYDVSATLVK